MFGKLPEGTSSGFMAMTTFKPSRGLCLGMSTSHAGLGKPGGGVIVRSELVPMLAGVEGEPNNSLRGMEVLLRRVVFVFWLQGKVGEGVMSSLLVGVLGDWFGAVTSFLEFKRLSSPATSPRKWGFDHWPSTKGRKIGGRLDGFENNSFQGDPVFCSCSKS